MRWNAAAPSRFDGALAAVPVTLLSRDEDVHHPVHLYSRSQGSSRRSLSSKTAVSTSNIGPREPRRPSIATPTETIRLSETVVPTPRSSHQQKPLLSARGQSPRCLGVQDEPQNAGLSTETFTTFAPKFLVCAGRALSNNDDDDNDCEQQSASVEKPPNTHGMTRSDTANEPLKSQRGLQRSDSELEIIISELREKIAHQQRQKTPRSSDEDPATATGGSRPGSAHQHSRKHLKNPLERMHMSSSSNLLLRRQASASQVAASRLVSEGTATMVTPAVLSSSASRGVLSTNNQQTQPVPTRTEAYDTRSKLSSEEVTQDGLRIRSYAGSDSAASQVPHFVSSTCLGLNLPSQEQPVCGSQSSTAEPTEPQPGFASQRRPSRPRLRTLADLELELERINEVSRANDASESLSPVGPWLVDHDSISDTPLTSSQSTGSLSPSSTPAQLTLAPEDPALSPRSRLLWLSDCGSDDAWEATSAGGLARLRPGTRAFPSGSRPTSALETRRLSNSKLLAKTPSAAKPRAVSAKATSASRRNSSHSSTISQDALASGAPTVAKNQRARSTSSSTGSAGRQRIR